ncbi:hypothetical protein KQH81_12435 [Clostridium cadaveris]|uniref:hypothetical protein n=1 Tax=Clostridium cadaveris TaxID=1529 RepID=UPI001E3DFCC1|nr:hypothetical protein [Clostridium cadaveris]UFH64135.1 hypothetical protein KQH81_12435 [Clostridium cadaveris]
MKMKKFFAILLVVTISLFVVACGGESKKESSGNDTEQVSSENINGKESSGIVIEQVSSENINRKENSENVNRKGTPETDIKNEIVMAGEGNTVNGVCQFILGEIYVTSRIEPSIITGSSSCYDVKTQGNIYIDVTLAMTNSGYKAKLINDIIDARIKLNNNEYTCFSLVESVDGSDLEKNALIKPKVVRDIHYVAEVPIEEVIGEIEVILTVDGKDFSRTINLEDMMSWNEYKEKMGW